MSFNLGRVQNGGQRRVEFRVGTGVIVHLAAYSLLARHEVLSFTYNCSFVPRFSFPIEVFFAGVVSGFHLICRIVWCSSRLPYYLPSFRERYSGS